MGPIHPVGGNVLVSFTCMAVQCCRDDLKGDFKFKIQPVAWVAAMS